MRRIWSIILCLFVVILVSGCLSGQDNGNETEATEYMGIKLTLISEQGNNAITLNCIEGWSFTAYKINDITLPPERGFPFQLVADGKYGYKWAKWIDHIELVKSSYKGYWKSRGYQ